MISSRMCASRYVEVFCDARCTTCKPPFEDSRQRRATKHTDTRQSIEHGPVPLWSDTWHAQIPCPTWAHTQLPENHGQSVSCAALYGPPFWRCSLPNRAKGQNDSFLLIFRQTAKCGDSSWSYHGSKCCATIGQSFGRAGYYWIWSSRVQKVAATVYGLWQDIFASH